MWKMLFENVSLIQLFPRFDGSKVFFYCCLFKLCHFCLRLLPLIGGYLSSINTRIISFKIDHLLFRPREELDKSMSVADTSSSGYVMSGTLLRFHSVSSSIGAPSKHRYVHVVSRVKLRLWLCLFFRCQTGICSLISVQRNGVHITLVLLMKWLQSGCRFIAKSSLGHASGMTAVSNDLRELGYAKGWFRTNTNRIIFSAVSHNIRSG